MIDKKKIILLNCKLFIAIWIIGCCFPLLSIAQVLDEDGREIIYDPVTGQPIVEQDTIEQGEYERVPDTVHIIYFHADNPAQEYIFSDSLLDNDFQQFEPTRKYDYANLGNPGSAHRPIVYETPFRQGFDVGLHQFDLYQLSDKDFRFYNIRQSYTNLYYSQGPEQNDANIKADFSRRFAKGLTFGVQYRRFLHSLDDDETIINQNVYYKLQGARNTSFAVGFWQHSKDDKYDAFLTYVSNQIEQQNHGGVIPGAESDSLLLNGNQFEDQTTVLIYLGNEKANSRYATRTLTFTQHYKLNKNPVKAKNTTPPETKLDSIAISNRDSTTIFDENQPILKDSLSILPKDSLSKQVIKDKNKPLSKGSTLKRPSKASNTPKRKKIETYTPPKRYYQLSHQASYRRAWYKFADASPQAAYYQNFYVDERGIRHYFDLHKVSNSFSINTFKARGGRNPIKQQKDLLEVGIAHNFHKINLEPVDTTVNNLFLKGKWNYTPSERLRIQTYAHLGLWNNAGDYRAEGDFFFNFGAIGSLKLKAIQQLYEANLVQTRTYISQQKLWDNDFAKTLETRLSASYYNKKWDVQLTGYYTLINNLIYFDNLGTPRQDDRAISLLQLTIQKDFTFGNIHFDNTITIQQSSAETIAVPTVFSKNSLYFEGKIFKKIMLARVGLDLRINTAYFANNYNPLTGQFYLQNFFELSPYPNVDAYVSFKVDRFRAFAKMQNLTSLVTPNIYYQTSHYPEIERYFRFGISWLFLDVNDNKKNKNQGRSNTNIPSIRR